MLDKLYCIIIALAILIIFLVLLLNNSEEGLYIPEPTVVPAHMEMPPHEYLELVKSGKIPPH